MVKDNKVIDKFSAPATASTTKMPDFMIPHIGAGTQAFRPEDIAWMGDDGASEDLVDRLLESEGFDRRSPLELLLLAMIDANPTLSGLAREVSLQKALAALVGNDGRGTDEKDDYELLLQMAWQYHCQFWNTPRPPQIAPIARQCLERLPAKDPRRNLGMVDPASPVKRLHKKFVKKKDLYIARATEQMHYRRMDRLRELTEIAERMQKLGIPVNLEALTPEIFRPAK